MGRKERKPGRKSGSGQPLPLSLAAVGMVIERAELQWTLWSTLKVQQAMRTEYHASCGKFSLEGTSGQDTSLAPHLVNLNNPLCRGVEFGLSKISRHSNRRLKREIILSRRERRHSLINSKRHKYAYQILKGSH